MRSIARKESIVGYQVGIQGRRVRFKADPTPLSKVVNFCGKVGQITAKLGDRDS
jgi:hypothetical protein